MKRILLLIITTMMILTLLAPASGPRAVQAVPLPQTGETTYTTYIPALFSKVPQWNPLRRVSVGDNHVCALTPAGGVKCWGQGRADLLGVGAGSFDFVNRPRYVIGMESGYISVAAGMFSTCALSSAGGVKCWGKNDHGQLGIGSTEDQSEPVQVPGLASEVAAISSGPFTVCALLRNGGVRCWGSGGSGQLGVGPVDSYPRPVDVIGLGPGNPAVDIAVADSAACALMATGGVKCWGKLYEHKDGTYFFSATPADVPGFTSNVRALMHSMFSSYRYDFCAIKSGGSLACISETETVSAELAGSNAGVAMVSGHCVVTFNGAGKCWGVGGSGDGQPYDPAKPVQIAGLGSGVQEINVGAQMICALMGQGGLKCWGGGSLGDGTNVYFSKVPVDVVDFP